MLNLNQERQPLQDRWKTGDCADPVKIKNALAEAIAKVRKNIPIIGSGSPRDITVDGIYTLVENNVWTTGFYPGMLWIAYAVTKDETFLKAGKEQTLSFKHRLDTNCEMDNHDVGFLFTLSAKADYLLTGEEEAREIAVNAAYAMSELYMHKAGVLNRGGGYSTKDKETEMFIIDCMNNIPLLFWASQVTGDRVLHEIAYNHARNAAKTLLFPCGASAHVGIAEIASGKLRRNMDISQGKGGPDAIWSRAQAWAVAGLPAAYRYTGDRGLLEDAVRAADFFLNSMPEDGVAPWDLYYNDNETTKDTSAAAIACCGLLELSEFLEPEQSAIYRGAAVKILNALIDRYQIPAADANMGILDGATYTFLSGKGVNVPNLFGDYYFMEALFRLTEGFVNFW